eukprot:CAMPEP_0178957886 /NCGR_PEP_ID=MMETSP0789-20121207/11215_1 /TAXON_ID=3005 /ORGANISM="Rhizosolenia setigera, Strain CCMP 1694" /LENGTH=164 /DNA_ID=CAMNT_0020640289 /DNA_START=272 /DNA_END=766 /DNA_ORIENTATION=-
MNSTVQGRPDFEDAIPPHLGHNGASTSIKLQRILNERKSSTNTEEQEEKQQQQLVDFMASFAETSKKRFILEAQREKLEEERNNKREKREKDKHNLEIEREKREGEKHNMGMLRQLTELGKDLEDAEMKLLEEKDEGVKNILKNSVKRIQENYDYLRETIMKNK